MKKSLFRIFSVFLSVVFLGCLCVPVKADMSSQVNDRLTRIFDEAKGEFFTTINKLLERHFRRSELNQEDLDRIEDAQNRIPHLFERVMIIAYQKDEPLFSGWIQTGDEASLQKFRTKFVSLATEYAARFVGSLFRQTPYAKFSMMLPHNKGKSTLDLVLQTLGYNANNSLPDIPEEARYKNKIDPDFYSQWGIDAVKARECWPVTQGTGVTVAVLDSGLDLFNSVFENKVLTGFNFLERTTPPWSDENPPMIDYGLHGTGVSSVLLAVAPDCLIMPVRISDSDTMNDPPYDYWLMEWEAAGIYYAVHHGAHVISISSRLSLAEPVIAEAVRHAYRNNVVICSSAGNMPRSHLGLRPEDMLYWAFDSEVLLIGGVEKTEDRIRPWPHSVPGLFVDCAAPSKDVFVLVPVYMKDMKNMYVAGTSLAAPIAAGVAALIRSAAPPSDKILRKPGAYVRLVSRCLKDTANLEILGMTEPDVAVGQGLIDASAAVKKIQELEKEKD